MRVFRLLAFALILSAACRAPTADDHFLKANDHFDKNRLPDAIVEYRAGLQIDPRRGDMRAKLADAYFRTGDMRGALSESVKAADLLPNDVVAQIGAGNLLLMARAFEDAKTRGKQALALDPTNATALVLLGNALVGMKDIDGAMKEYQEAIALAPDRDSAYLNLGTIQVLRSQRAEAEATFRKAVEVAPKSVDAHLALANFLLASGRVPEAERQLRTALVLEPTNATVNRALGVLFMSSNRSNEAEPYFQAVAKATNSPQATLSLADYYLFVRRFDDARKILIGLASIEESYSMATIRLAALEASEGQRVPAMAKLRSVLAKRPGEMSARVLLAKLLLADGNHSDALAEAHSIVQAEPTSPAAGEAYLVIGSIEASRNHPEDATKAYEEALKWLSQPIAAHLVLASLHLANGAVDKAASYAQQALALQPNNPQVRAMSVRVFLVQGDTAKAAGLLESLRKDFPGSPTVLNLVAAQQLANRQLEAARASYTKAANLAPSDIEAMIGLVRIDLASGRVKEAVSRIDAGLQTNNLTGEFLVLAANAYAATGNPAKVEALLKRAIEVAPAQLAAYGLLGSLYIIQRRLDEALGQFQESVRRNPKSIPTNTMLGMLLEMQKRLPEAEQQYQRVLALDSRAAVAANNLAWLYVSSNRNLDQALNLAQTAVRQLPDDPHINDTLGWIYFKKNMAASAIAPLERSVKKDPINAVVHYHLGMAYAEVGDVVNARKSLQRALTLKPDFDGAIEARKLLTEIGK